MKEVVYLDSSSLVKRYVKEPGSKIAKEVYLKAYSGELTITFNSWNIGEVLGAFDKAHVRGILSNRNYLIAKGKFLLETRRLARLGVLRLIPIRFRLLIESWRLLEKHHLYQADALQIVSAKAVNATNFLTGDKRVYEAAKTEGLNAVLTI
ncbi:MAG: type II toxin-antitoxin system VapC family toxin [Candidatus Bathyarchaeia archaeon]